MAKIAFFTESLPRRDDLISNFAYDLVCSLADQQHEITIFSTFRRSDPVPPAKARVEILRPFKKWSWLELPRVMPILMQLRPDILHIVQPRAEALQGLTNAMNAIAGFSPLIGHPAVVSSFYDLRAETLSAHKPLLASSDAITASNRSQLEILKAYRRGKKSLTLLLPVPGRTQDEDPDFDSEAPPEFITDFIKSQSKLIFVPGEIDEHRDLETLFSNLAEALSEFANATLLFGGGWGTIPPKRRQALMRHFDLPELGHRVLICGALSSQTERFILRQAEIVFIASLANESLRLSRLLREALILSAVLLMGAEQAKLDSLPWQDREHAFIAETVPQGWLHSLRLALSDNAMVSSIRHALPEFARFEVLDRPGNVMSRLYAQLLGQRNS